MQLLMRTMLFVGILFLMSCDNIASDDNTEKSTDNDSTEVAVDEDNAALNETENDGKVITVTYDGATTYAAVADYRFITEKDEMILVRGNTFGEEETIIVPDNMLEEITEELEGPPGANPDLIGKTFKIHYDANDNPIKIELIK